ncbi:MAG: rane protein [Arthrobacter sp.]|nr:rane protein [Arthrobacter sp.]MCW2782671.1 rane protein [Marmoricola sp.]
MIWLASALAVVLLATAFGSWLSWTATRLDNLHHRVELARESVRRRLLERSGWTLEIAAAGVLDDAEAVVLADAAARARAVDDGFEAAESDLSSALRAVFDDAGGTGRLREMDADLLDKLEASSHRVELARRFHNDLVASARHLRGRLRVRWFHLTGHAGPLDTIDFDDVAPDTFGPGR